MLIGITDAHIVAIDPLLDGFHRIQGLGYTCEAQVIIFAAISQGLLSAVGTVPLPKPGTQIFGQPGIQRFILERIAEIIRGAVRGMRIPVVDV